MRGLVLSLYLFFQATMFGQIVVPANGCVMENFDSSNPWTFGGTNSSWTYGNPNKLQVTDDITGGGKCIILGGNTANSTYNSNEDSWAKSPVYDFSQITDPYLEFNFYWSNEGSTSYDEIWMEYSLNGGSSWQIVSPPTGTGGCYDQNWYNYPDNWGGNVGGCFSGAGGPSGWVLVRKCISSLGGQPQVEFRFRITTGSQCNNYGATVDNWTICDASITAYATGQCTTTFGEYSFNDFSHPCPDQWYWDFGDGTNSNLQNPSHIYNTPGTYNVTLSSTSSSAATSGCGTHTDQYTFSITVNDSASIDYGNSQLCDSDPPLTPTITGGTLNGFFSSSPSGLAINSSTGEVNPETSTPGTYQITFSPVNACIPAAQTSIEILSVPFMISTSDIISCSGDEVIIPSFDSQPYGLNTTWAIPSGQDIGFGTSGSGSIAPFTASNTSNSPDTITFIVTPVSTNSCPGIPDTFNVVIGNLPNSAFIADTTIGCSPLLVSFQAASSGTQCLWNFGDGLSSSHCNNVNHIYSAGTYIVSLTLTSELGCKSTDSLTQLIESLESPFAGFTYSPHLITTETSEVELTNNSTHTNQIYWEITGSNGYYLNSTDEVISIELPKDTATYTICLAAMNTNGCEDLICEEITVQNKLSFYIPNSFTPNNDGLNDYFGPVFTGVEPSEYNLIIFNRWGQQIFESKDINTLWDGQYKSKKAPTGIYLWKLEYKEEGEVEIINTGGHVNLIRGNRP